MGIRTGGGGWFNEFLAKAKAAGDVVERRVNLRAVEAAVTGVNLSGVSIAGAAPQCGATPELLLGASEAEWQGVVVAEARFRGWTCYHTLDSRGSDEGWLDLVLAKECVATGEAWLYVVELKTETGVESEAQKFWARVVTQVGAAVPRKSGSRLWNFLWRPSHWEVVKKLLAEEMPCA